MTPERFQAIRDEAREGKRVGGHFMPDDVLELLNYIDLLHEDLRITRAERDAEKKKNMQAAKDNAADHRAWQEVVTVARADSWDGGYVDGYFDAKENHHEGPDEALRRTPNPYWKDTA